MATLVARGVPPPEVFAAVAREVGRLLGVDATHMARYEADGAGDAASRAGAAPRQPPAIGIRIGPATGGLSWTYARPPSVGCDAGHPLVGGAPIVVDGRLWGVMIASTTSTPLPADTESRIAAFTELVATAISNTEAAREVRRLADEQAALRRVATLVARGRAARASCSPPSPRRSARCWAPTSRG